jgi:choline dehydrogenase-like flavoprotein
MKQLAFSAVRSANFGLTDFYADIPHSRDTLFPRHRVGRVHQFYEVLRPRRLGSVDISVIQSWIFPHHLRPPTELAWELLRPFRSLLTSMLYVAAIIEMKPIDENRVMLSETRRDLFGNPIAHLHLSFSEEDKQTFAGAREIVTGILGKLGADPVHVKPGISFSRHHIGACRMGSDRRTSVVDAHLRVHDTPNLYVLGSETFVTGGAVTPTLTIVALALRLAERITKVLSEQHNSAGG